jgi:hypothetical protein
MDAYGVQRDQIRGPDWATADAVDGGALFDVSAKVPEGATKEQIATMLQNLLKERFKLSVHREQLQNAGYTLVVAKAGPRLKESSGPPGESERNQTVKGPVNLQIQKDGFTLPEDGARVGALATMPLRSGQAAPLNRNGPNEVQTGSVSVISPAMERQLGLKLEASRIAVDMLVIDHAERTPTPN